MSFPYKYQVFSNYQAILHIPHPPPPVGKIKKQENWQSIISFMQQYKFMYKRKAQL